MRQKSITTLIAAAALAAATLMAGPSTIGYAASEDTAGRYTMSPTDDGFVRLDTKTGQMSLCRQADGSWACAPMTDATSGTSGTADQLAALRQQNADLKAEVERLEGMLGLRDGTPGAKSPPQRPQFSLPSEKQVEETLDYFANILKKFQERLKDLEKGTQEKPPEERAL